MDEKVPAVSPTLRAHRRQFVWQILVPFLVMAGVLITAAVLVAVGSASQARLWADVSIIWLIAPLLVLALIAAAVLVFAIVGLAKLLKITPRYTARAQAISFVAAAGIRKLANGILAPFVWFEQAKAVLKSLFGG